MTQHFRSLAFPFVLVAVLTAGAAGCGDEPTTPTDVGGVPFIERFVGTLPVGGSVFYSFTVPNEGEVTLTLVNLTVDGAPTTATVGLGIGSPLGVGCTAGISVAVGPGGVPHLRQSLPPGVYCAKVSDTGQLTSPANFSLNIGRPR